MGFFSSLGQINVWSLLRPIIESDLEVIVIALGGYVLAKKGFLPRDAQKVISSLNVYFFTPCLVFEKVGNGLNLKMLIDLSLLPVFYVIISAASILISFLLAKLFRLTPRQRNFATACITFQNSNSLPLALVSSLATTVKDLLWDKIPDDTPDKVASRGIMYLLIFSQLGQALRWSYGYRILLSPNQPEDPLPIGNRSWSHSDVNEEEIQNLLASSANVDGVQNSVQANEGSTVQTDSSAISKNDNVQVETSNEEVGGFGAASSKISKFIVLLLDFFSPPLYSLFIALFIAVVPPLQRFFFEEGSFVEGSITSGIRMAGQVAVPMILVVLGASLATDISKTEPTQEVRKNNDTRVIIVCLLGRMVVVPLALLPADRKSVV